MNEFQKELIALCWSWFVLVAAVAAVLTVAITKLHRTLDKVFADINKERV